MLSSQSDLEELRRRLDAIDDRLQDLLIERLEIVSRVAAEKRGGSIPVHVPAREAQMIRRLVARQEGAFPTGPLIRIWRELLGATTRAQGPFAVGVCVPQESPGIWDIARDHYGSYAAMTVYQTTLQVIRAVTDRRITVGVLPMPQDGDSDPWWVHLLSPEADNTPRVIARLPFGPRGNARLAGGDTLAIGYGPRQSSGNDRTLLATENAVDISHGRFSTAFAALGLTCTMIVQGEQRNTLIEIDGFIALADPRLRQVQERLGDDLHRVLMVGSYALPLPEAAAQPQASGLTSPSLAAAGGYGVARG